MSSAQFTLDAARVAPVNNPGNLLGLAVVKRGTRVWLMMYFTERSLARKMQRTTAYTITYRGRIVFQLAYKSTAKRGESGRFSRYAVYAVPKSLPLGQYVFTARLGFGSRHASRLWRFSLGKVERIASTTGVH